MFKKVLTIFIIFISLQQFNCELPEVSDIDPPFVTLVYPANGTVLTGSVIVTVSATDNKEVSEVYYYFDGELMERMAGSVASFELDLSPYEDNQTHFFQGGANDNSGNKGLSVQVTVLISDRLDITPPDVAITNPTNGQLVIDTVKVVANAFDASGIREVAFFVAGDSVATDKFYPYDYILSVKDFAQIGDLTIQAKAVDNANNWRLSTPVSVTISDTTAIDGTPPTITILYPLDGQVVGNTVKVSVNAFDSESGIDRVEYHINGETAFSNNVSPYEYIWSLVDVPEGAQRTVQAKAYDNAGNYALSDQVSVTKEIQSQDITPPEITILYPLDGQIVGDLVRVSVNAFDAISGIREVAYFVDGDSVFTNNTYPYDYTWSLVSVPEGEQRSIQAKAFDNAGNFSLSGQVTVTKEVQERDVEAPVITILYPLANATVSGTVTIALDAIDNVGVEVVEFYIDGGEDGAPNSRLTQPPWNYDWDTSGLTSGSVHTLYIKAYDVAGNVGTNGPVGYTIQ